MRLDRDARGQGPAITGFARDGFRVDDMVLAALTLTPERAAAWSPPMLEALSEGDVADLLMLDPPPEFVLLGTGTSLRRPAPGFVAALEARGIGIEAMDSRAAARAWGVLRGEGRWIAAALYPLV